MLTKSDYEAETGDIVMVQVEQFNLLSAWATQTLEEHLGRRLWSGERTERVEINMYGRAYPAAVPVTELSASAAEVATVPADDYVQYSSWHRFDDDFVIERSVEWDSVHVDLVYTGGFTTSNLPAALRKALCDLIWYRLHNEYNPADPKAVATQVRVGDVALGFSQHTKRTGLDAMIPGISGSVRGYFLGRL